MLLQCIYADGIRFDLGVQPGFAIFGGKTLGTKFDLSLLGLNLGYRWVFKNRIFLDWDFLSFASNSVASFKVGKLLDDKLAVYGIITPICGWAPIVLLNEHVREHGPGWAMEGKHKRIDTVSGIGANVGGGFSYRVKKTLSLVGELRLAVFATKDPFDALRGKAGRHASSDRHVSFGARALFGISIHSGALNDYEQ